MVKVFWQRSSIFFKNPPRRHPRRAARPSLRLGRRPTIRESRRGQASARYRARTGESPLLIRDWYASLRRWVTRNVGIGESPLLIRDLYARQKPAISFEFFPPQT